MILFDTHTLLWYTHEPEKLSVRVRKEIELSRRAIAYVSAISFWELALKIKSEKLNIGMPVSEYRKRVLSLGFFEILHVSEQIFIDSVNLTYSHKDPADRIIIAQAKAKNLKLLTKDQDIQKHYKKTIW